MLTSIAPARRRSTILGGCVTVVAAAAALLGAPAAHAAAPDPVGYSFTDPAGVSCAFPITVTIDGKLKVIDFTNGTSIVTSPGMTATIRNDLTGKTTTLSITGPGKDFRRPDGKVDVVLEGRNLMSGNGHLVLIIGRATFVLDPTTGFADAPAMGAAQTIDVCPRIA